MTRLILNRVLTLSCLYTVQQEASLSEQSFRKQNQLQSWNDSKPLQRLQGHPYRSERIKIRSRAKLRGVFRAAQDYRRHKRVPPLDARRSCKAAVGGSQPDTRTRVEIC